MLFIYKFFLWRMSADCFWTVMWIAPNIIARIYPTLNYNINKHRAPINWFLSSLHWRNSRKFITNTLCLHEERYGEQGEFLLFPPCVVYAVTSTHLFNQNSLCIFYGGLTEIWKLPVQLNESSLCPLTSTWKCRKKKKLLNLKCWVSSVAQTGSQLFV